VCAVEKRLVVVCTRCTSIFLFVFSYIEIYNKNFSKESGLVEIQPRNKILPHLSLSYQRRARRRFIKFTMLTTRDLNADTRDAN
jgi:hypothetical protein